MKFQKYLLGKLNMVYSVSSILLNNEIHFIAATEAKGKCLIFQPPNWEASDVWHEPGGAMSILPVKGFNGVFFAIQKFFPFFNAKEAEIVYAKLNKKKPLSWSIENIIDLPYVHRIAIVVIENSLNLISSTLCGGKEFKNDWSKPGAVYLTRIPKDNYRNFYLEPILEGISKNHGMHLTNINNRTVLLVTGKEGIFLLYVPKKSKNKWDVERLIDYEVSDVYVNDIDSDGNPELITIEPFHGSELKIYKFLNNSWRVIFIKQINFGHVVWSGKIFGYNCLIVGNRGGKKDLLLLKFEKKNPIKFEEIIIDENIGPTQVDVVNNGTNFIILSANNFKGEVALYYLKH